MTHNNVELAHAYYTAFGKKNFIEMEKYLHPDVRFISPFGQLTGKDAIIQAAQAFATMFTTLTVRTKFGSGDQAAIVYDFDWLGVEGTFSAAVVMAFEDGLITSVELFYDPRPFA
jgi:ketosteroid isomerase-like protein